MDVRYKLDALPDPTATMMLFEVADSYGPNEFADHTHSRGWFLGWDLVLGEIQPDRHLMGAPANGGTATSEPIRLRFVVESGTTLKATLADGGDQIRLSWPSQGGRVYQLRSAAGPWSDLGGAREGTGGTDGAGAAGE